jgi:cardiolipin synthase
LQLLNSAFAVVVVFTQRRNPAVSWAWLMVIALIPVAGFVIYIIVGQDSRKYRAFEQKIREDERLFTAYQNGPGALAIHADLLDLTGAEHLNDLVYLNARAGGGALTCGNQVTLFHGGRAKFQSLLADIQNASNFIFIQYYILRDDETGRHIIRQLIKKALDGVEVRLLIDGMGCTFTPRALFTPLIKAGGCVGVFMPPALIRINYRNHRKLVIIDGETAYLGGLNIGNEYVGMTKRFGFWRDTHMRLRGGTIQELTLRFIMDWNFAVKEELPFTPRYFPVSLPAAPAGGVRMQIVSSGPDTRYPNILHGFCKTITEARRSIYIQTPYFVPDESIFGALRVAALSGIDVRIMIPAHPDHPFVYWAGLSYLGELLECGVKCYEYEKGFIHSKTLMIDSIACWVGTANMDVRSFILNFECSAFICDAGITRELEENFMGDLTDCRVIEPDTYNSRGKIVKIKESLSRLLSPLL